MTPAVSTQQIPREVSRAILRGRLPREELELGRVPDLDQKIDN